MSRQITKYKWLFLLLLCIEAWVANAQSTTQLDSLHQQVQTAANDSSKYIAYSKLYTYYEEINRDSALYYADRGEKLARENQIQIAVAACLGRRAYQLMTIGKYAGSYTALLEAFQVLEQAINEKRVWTTFQVGSVENSRLFTLSFTNHVYGLLMHRTNHPEEAITYTRKGIQLGEQFDNPLRVITGKMNLGLRYLEKNMLDSAFYYEKQAEHLSVQANWLRYQSFIKSALGDMYLQKGDSATALQYFYDGVKEAQSVQNNSSLLRNYLRLNRYYLAENEGDSALHYARLQLQLFHTLGMESGFEFNLGVAYEQLYKSYLLEHVKDSALHYASLAIVENAKVMNDRIASLSEFQTLSFREQTRLREIEKEKQLYQNRVRIYALLGGLALFSIIAFLLFLNNRQKQKAKVNIEHAYNDLRTTQQQLIHSEKMASLGELTAGIAHEIQNPLNFVNNFSEVNVELIDEITQDIQSGKIQEALSAASMMKANQEKIIHHGKRADGIVKSMLQHSRKGAGQKELTDINALAKEYLNLAYHGFRAKDKSFNVDLKTSFDPAIPKINVIQQDIGRVLLNLITNAFQSFAPKSPEGDFLSSTEDKIRRVTLSTKLIKKSPSGDLGAEGGIVKIIVADNGPGIPPGVLDKIFQPFFTTKPTGEGTGLGLSISFDIIKAHQGNINVDSKLGEGTTFTIELPAA